MLLVGSWTESSEADREAIERIANRPYSAVAEVAGKWVNEADSPIARASQRALESGLPGRFLVSACIDYKAR